MSETWILAAIAYVFVAVAAGLVVEETIIDRQDVISSDRAAVVVVTCGVLWPLLLVAAIVRVAFMVLRLTRRARGVVLPTARVVQ